MRRGRKSWQSSFPGTTPWQNGGARAPGESHLRRLACPSGRPRGERELRKVSVGRAAGHSNFGNKRECVLVAHERAFSRLTGEVVGACAAQLPQLTERALVGAATSVIGAKLMAGQADRLVDLEPELVQLILMPYLGSEEAYEVAEATP
jgi:hypothetical protein